MAVLVSVDTLPIFISAEFVVDIAAARGWTRNNRQMLSLRHKPLWFAGFVFDRLRLTELVDVSVRLDQVIDFRIICFLFPPKMK